MKTIVSLKYFVKNCINKANYVIQTKWNPVNKIDQRLETFQFRHQLQNC